MRYLFPLFLFGCTVQVASPLPLCTARRTIDCIDALKLNGTINYTAEAMDLFQQHCTQGDMLGCAYLGFMYDDGMVVTRDYKQAVSLYQKACDGGSSREEASPNMPLREKNTTSWHA